MSACGCAGHGPSCRCGFLPTNDAADLVARLRAYANGSCEPGSGVADEAADRIEELEERLSSELDP